MSDTETLGARLAHAIAAKDESALRALLADDVDFRGLTPGRTWEGTGPDAVVRTVLGSWFEPHDAVSETGERGGDLHGRRRFEPHARSRPR